ncbi:ribosomal protein S18-alanine N-acetyltransferase [Geobacter sulfurreducens]|nr:ribosomal protein S18-alanine N-acetyltransferase [Geobacter sulfurreducens]AJY71236.1 alanine acetyltransferase [Geobacter sulfurreducens]QVW33712.1 ribosomal protein S18-alanine N-acetyltransferase [Geobacter sulfurreducens]
MNTADCPTIMPMTEGDLDEVLQIESDSFPRPWTRDHFVAELASPRSFPVVARSPGGLIAGYICPTLLFDEGEILDVAVRRDFRGQGIGALLVTHAVAELAGRGARTVHLEVRVSNTSARTLYRRLGFAETGRRPRYYENGEDAVLMAYSTDEGEGSPHAV